MVQFAGPFRLPPPTVRGATVPVDWPNMTPGVAPVGPGATAPEPVTDFGYENRRSQLDLGRENFSRWGRFAAVVPLTGCGSTVSAQPISFPSLFAEAPIMTFGVRLISGQVANGMPLATATVVEWVMDPRAATDRFRQHVKGAKMGFCLDMPFVSDVAQRAGLMVEILLSFEGVAVKRAQGA